MSEKDIEIKTENEEEVREEKVKLSSLFDTVYMLALATIIVAFAFTFVFRTVGVSGGSMIPTLNNNDRIILSAFYYNIEPGEIVVTCQPSKYPYIESTLVKRVIATEGQIVDIDFEKGIVTVDGQILDEPYINQPTLDPEYFSGPFIVPDGEVFVMGDNRNHSTDSRDYRVGTIREEYILGRALFRIAPFGQFKIG